MTENQIAREIVDAAYQIHVALGPGLFESVYETVLSHELTERGFQVARQKPIPVHYKDLTFDEGFRADLIVNEMVIVEIKSVEKTSPVHRKQVQTYLKLTGLKLGLLINFGEALIKDGITRIVNGLEDDSQ